MTQHKHHDLIVAWAKGAQIQVKCDHMGWQDVLNRKPAWDEDTEYRIKPAPKPDVVLYAMIEAIPEIGHAKIRSVHANVHRIKTDTCMFIFDGETGKLKKAGVIDEA